MLPKASRLADRRSRVGRTLLTDDLDALLFLDLQNIRYLTGFTGSDGAYLLERDRSVLMVDGRYTTQAGEETSGTKVFQYREKVEGIAEVLAGESLRNIGFEAAAVNVETYGKLKEKVSAVRLQPLAGDLVNIRAVKDDGEIASLRTAAAIASRTLLALLKDVRPGMQERDVALELEYRMRQNGAGGVSFPTITASGMHSALPHAAPGSRLLAMGDALVMDYGAVYEGYHSDETCTFVLGQASAPFQEAYGIVKAAHDQALAAVKAGVAGAEIDRIARDHIEAAGLGRFFSHGTGHGTGLDVHEPPRIAAPSKAVLEAGMVVTIEPGVYFPGKWGIRIEDMVLVRENDCEVLSKVPKDLTVL